MTIKRRRLEWTAFWRWPVLAVVGLATMSFVPAPSALAQSADPPPDPGAIARRCANALQTITRRGVGDSAMLSERTIRLMAHLAGEGAPPPVLRRVALEGKRRIDHNTRARLTQLNRVAYTCVHALRRLDADPALIRAILRARAQGAEALLRARVIALRRIAAALNELTGGSGGSLTIDSLDSVTAPAPTAPPAPRTAEEGSLTSV